MFQWKETDSSQLMDSKLKCVFVMPMPDSNNVTANGAATSETSKPASEFHAATNSAVSATQAMTSSSSPKVGIYNPALYLHSSSPRLFQFTAQAFNRNHG